MTGAARLASLGKHPCGAKRCLCRAVGYGRSPRLRRFRRCPHLARKNTVRPKPFEETVPVTYKTLLAQLVPGQPNTELLRVVSDVAGRLDAPFS